MTAISPDCRDGNHRKCTGDAWDMELDNVTDCQCQECLCRYAATSEQHAEIADKLDELRRVIAARELQDHILRRRIRILGAILARDLRLQRIVEAIDRPANAALGIVRGWAYRAGRRPLPGSVLYSPSAALLYEFRDNSPADAFREAFERANARVRNGQCPGLCPGNEPWCCLDVEGRA
ncbi:hypothetical protein [Arthrobacter sp. 18067]|uniref:hypothetical protein n=1 Tax=Arthrobacter sp. 18067 TaxID=2681413 RepID=UPI00135B467D|nr:hypothetical protein [Arthrobacter sp. 18067]